MCVCGQAHKLNSFIHSIDFSTLNSIDAFEVNHLLFIYYLFKITETCLSFAYMFMILCVNFFMPAATSAAVEIIFFLAAC